MIPIRFIGEAVDVEFDERPVLEKRPGHPDRFVWGGETYHVAEELSAWVDYSRRGRMKLNMRPEHAATAELRGSWGVGRFYFRVRTCDGRVFDLYYDRAPRSARVRAGGWYLYREMAGSADEGKATSAP